MNGLGSRRAGALAGLALALAGLAGLVPGGPGVGRVDGASPDLTIAGPARYDVRPGQHRVHVSVALTVTNRTVATITTRFVVDTFNLAVLPGATGFRATQGKAAARASVARADRASTLVTVRLAKGLPSGASTAVTLAFDLVDRGGSASRAIRVGDALVAFPVWAYGTPGTAGSSATVRFPAGYRVSVASGHLGKPVTAPDGTISLASGPLADPWSLAAYLQGERPGAFVETPLKVKLDDRTATLTLRAWKDDKGWTSRTSALLRKALPVLSRALGLPYPTTGRLVVEEATPRSLEGYGAVYDAGTGTIRLAWSAAPSALIRAVAHTWLPPTTFADRWIVEGLASRAAATAAAALKVPAGLTTYGPNLAKAAVPLNAWVAGSSRDGTVTATDAYGLAASAELFRLLATRTGATGLQAIVRGAAAGLPSDPAGTTVRPVDWRGLLDLVADRTGVDATDLWRQWVVRPDEVGLLDARSTARADLAALVARAGDWEVPADIAAAVGTWHFDLAEARMSRVAAALEARDRLVVAATVAGLTVPDDLRQAYLRAGPDGTIAAIDGARTIVDEIAGARETGSAATTLLDRIGLLGQDPAAELVAARTAFEAGDLQAAQSRATDARSAWAGAADIGGLRLRSVLAVLILVALGLVYLALRSRGRSARRSTRRGAAR